MASIVPRSPIDLQPDRHVGLGRSIVEVTMPVTPFGQRSSAVSVASTPGTGQSATADTTSGSAPTAQRTHWIG